MSLSMGAMAGPDDDGRQKAKRAWLKIARIRLGSGRNGWAGGQVSAGGGQPWHWQLLLLDYKFSNLEGNLVVLDGLVAAGAPLLTDQGRSWCSANNLPRYCAVCTMCCTAKIPASSDQMRLGPAGHDQNGDLAEGTSGASPYEEDTCALPHFPTLSGVFCDPWTGAAHLSFCSLPRACC